MADALSQTPYSCADVRDVTSASELQRVVREPPSGFVERMRVWEMAEKHLHRLSHTIGAVEKCCCEAAGVALQYHGIIQ